MDTNQKEASTTENKIYVLRSSAVRAARREVGEGNFEIQENDDGLFTWSKNQPKVGVKAAPKKKKEITIVVETEASPKPELPAFVSPRVASRMASPTTVTPAPVIQTEKKVTSGVPTKTKMPTWAQGKHQSEIESPTKSVWEIADQMFAADPTIARKTIVETCVRQGIAYYTARTQVQLWRTARLESEANAAKARKL